MMMIVAHYGLGDAPLLFANPVRQKVFVTPKKNREAIFLASVGRATRARTDVPPVDVRPSRQAKQTPSWLAQQTPSRLAQQKGTVD